MPDTQQSHSQIVKPEINQHNPPTQLLVGGKTSTYAPAFTPDNQHFLCICTSSIKVYSVHTGLVVRTLSSNGTDDCHSGQITSVAISPSNPIQVFSASMDGSIRLWDLNDGALLGVWNMNMSIMELRMHPSNASYAYVVALVKGDGINDPDQAGLFLLNLNLRTYQKLIEPKHFACMDVSENGQYVVITTSKKMLVGTLVSDVDVFTSTAPIVGGNDVRPITSSEMTVRYKWTIHKNKKIVACMKIQPRSSELVVAVGEKQGVIKLWTFTSTDPIIRIFHWHARCLNQILFTHDGRHLLSGGDEAALVIWHVESGQKQFMTQLGSEIVSVSVSADSCLYALAHLDNSIRIVNAATLTVLQHITGISKLAINTLPPTAVVQPTLSKSKKKYQATAVSKKACIQSKSLMQVESRTGYLVLERNPGTLQMYDARADCHVCDVTVVPWNYVPGSDIVKPQVLHTVFDPFGKWMATADISRGHMCSLRIWNFDSVYGKYVLNTKIEGISEVTCMAFRPLDMGMCQLATGHANGKFSVWEVVKGCVRSLNQWRCHASGYYRVGLVPQAVCWAGDGSVLAIGYGSFVTVWDPEVLGLVGVLTLPGCTSVWTNIGMPVNVSPFLVGCSESYLVVWNLLDLTVLWAYSIPDKQCVTTAFHSCLNHFVLVTTSMPGSGAPVKSRIHVFTYNQPVPIFVQYLDESVLTIVLTPILSQSADQSLLGDSRTIEAFYLTSANDLKRLVIPTGDQVESGGSAEQRVLPGMDPVHDSNRCESTPKVMMRPNIITSHEAPHEHGLPVPHAPKHTSIAFSVIEGPCHAIPSVEFVFDKIMHQFLDLRVN